MCLLSAVASFVVLFLDVLFLVMMMLPLRHAVRSEVDRNVGESRHESGF